VNLLGDIKNPLRCESANHMRDNRATLNPK
jgi:hypothetical protein